MNTPWPAMASSPSFQKFALRRIGGTLRSDSIMVCGARSLPRSGTIRKIAPLATKVSAASSRNTLCQSVMRSSSSAGLDADSAPSPPQEMSQPLSVARRFNGNHRVNTLMLDMRQPETPSPIRARATISPPRLWLSPNKAAPVPASINRPAFTRRGP